jgi:hypothetical protein
MRDRVIKQKEHMRPEDHNKNALSTSRTDASKKIPSTQPLKNESLKSTRSGSPSQVLSAMMDEQMRKLSELLREEVQSERKHPS